jgi:hypothetical protein
MSVELGRVEQDIYRVAIEASPCATLVDAPGTALANREAERLFVPPGTTRPPIGSPAGGSRPLGKRRDLQAGAATVFPVSGLNLIETARGRSWSVRSWT